ncbi:hypothetical protein X943_000424 [Babesia divergens]|uniref:Uncharacterized protein n=1 Tax=Babesia divergens TaxID=32595 RepID=A0AAD9GJ89_BABDI|nr:hypothetical protein X943_000424 [Babesia divergens]
MDQLQQDSINGEDSDTQKKDIILAEEKKNRITVVEVGVTCQDNLEQVEIEKKHKYEALKKQMEHHKWNKNTEIRLIPYVMTCDGLVTRYHRNYRQELGVPDRMEGQIQRICLQQTYDFVMRELGIEVMEEIEGWAQGMPRRAIPSLPDPGPTHSSRHNKH